MVAVIGVIELVWVGEGARHSSQLLSRLLLVDGVRTHFTKDFVGVVRAIGHLVDMVVGRSMVAHRRRLAHQQSLVPLNGAADHFAMGVPLWLVGSSSLGLLHRSFQQNAAERDRRVRILRLAQISRFLVKEPLVVGATSVRACDLAQTWLLQRAC